jgi:hypothetical protein
MKSAVLLGTFLLAVVGLSGCSSPESAPSGGGTKGQVVAPENSNASSGAKAGVGRLPGKPK